MHVPCVGQGVLSPACRLQASLDAFENADTPVHMVMVEILGLNMKGAAAAPLFQCMFFLHESAWWSQVQLQGLRTQTHPVEKNVARWGARSWLPCTGSSHFGARPLGGSACPKMACATLQAAFRQGLWLANGAPEGARTRLAI